MFQIQFSLKQHTPLIHFQHDQEGATLRASEVKPKLDKFLIQQYDMTEVVNENGKDIIVPKKDYTDLFINNGKQHLALDFKIKIIPNKTKTFKNVSLGPFVLKKKEGEELYEQEFPYPLVLANMGGKPSVAELKDFTMFETIDVVISSYSPDLINKITSIAASFFFYNNFGNRQNKGFGSFTVTQINGGKIHGEIIPSKNHFIKPENFQDFKTLFGIIDYYWKRLKSGINYSKHKIKDRATGEERWVCDSKRYQKSFLFQYINTHLPSADQHTWEKRWLKEKFFGLTPLSGGKPPKYSRALLGMQDKFEFISRDFCNPNSSERSQMLKNFGKRNIKPSNAGNEIDRIQGPITFKPVINGEETVVYILINDAHIRNGIYNSTSVNRDFSFSDGHNTNNLSLPDTPIDYHDLLDKYHIHLGKKFEAKNFKWNTIAVVETGKTL